jgi:hypothetical protein
MTNAVIKNAPKIAAMTNKIITARPNDLPKWMTNDIKPYKQWQDKVANFELPKPKPLVRQQVRNTGNQNLDTKNQLFADVVTGGLNAAASAPNAALNLVLNGDSAYRKQNLKEGRDAAAISKKNNVLPGIMTEDVIGRMNVSENEKNVLRRGNRNQIQAYIDSAMMMGSDVRKVPGEIVKGAVAKKVATSARKSVGKVDNLDTLKLNLDKTRAQVRATDEKLSNEFRNKSLNMTDEQKSVLMKEYQAKFDSSPARKQQKSIESLLEKTRKAKIPDSTTSSEVSRIIKESHSKNDVNPKDVGYFVNLSPDNIRNVTPLKGISDYGDTIFVNTKSGVSQVRIDDWSKSGQGFRVSNGNGNEIGRFSTDSEARDFAKRALTIENEAKRQGKRVILSGSTVNPSTLPPASASSKVGKVDVAKSGTPTQKIVSLAEKNNIVKNPQGLDVNLPKSGVVQDSLTPSKVSEMATPNKVSLVKPSYGDIIPPNGKNVSGFAKTIAKDNPELAKIIPGFDRLTNVKTYTKSLQRVAADPNVVYQGLLQKGKKLTLDDTADAYILLKKFIAEDNTDSAAILAKNLAKDEREAGRIVQLASSYNKLTPGGALKDVYKTIQQFKDKTGKDIILDPEKIKKITDLANEVQKYEVGTREWEKAAALLEKEKSVLPNTFLGIVSKLQTMAQLLNPKTAIRNFVGNQVLDFVEDVARLEAAGIDKALYGLGFIKERNLVVPNLKTKWLGQLTGFKMGVEDVNLGIRTTGAQGQFEITKDIFKPGSLGNKLEKALGYELSAFDKMFYTGRFEESLQNIVKAKGAGKPKQWMVDQAEAEALYATFQNNSMIAQGLSKTKKGLNLGKEWGMGDLLMKYPKTPGNIVSVGLDYSPIGFVKGLKGFYDNAKNFDPAGQRNAILNLSRGLTGTGMILGGAMLAKKGIITGKGDKDKDVKQAQREAGQGPFSFNFSALGRMLEGKDTAPQEGDVTANYDWLQPNAIQLSMGANMVINSGNATNMISDMWDTLGAGIDTATQQPVFSGAQRFVSNVGTKGAIGAVGEAIKGAPASFIPSVINQTGQMFDNTQRNVYSPNYAGGVAKSIQSKIPGARNLLEPKISPSTGQTMEQYQGGSNNLINVFLNPAFVRKYHVTPEAKEVIDIYNRSGETQQMPRIAGTTIKSGGKQKVLTPQEATQYQQFIGTRTQSEFARLVKDPKFMALDDSGKAKKMSSVLTDINSQAKKALVDKGGFAPNIGYEKSPDSPQNTMQKVGLYGKGVLFDPANTIKSVATGQPARKITGSAKNGGGKQVLVFERKKGLSAMDNGNKDTQVDHIIPLSLGGSNDSSNLRYISNADNQRKAKLEVQLINEIKAGKISKKKAQDKVREFSKSIEAVNPPAVEDKKTVKKSTKKTTKKKVSKKKSKKKVSRSKAYKAIAKAKGGQIKARVRKPSSSGVIASRITVNKPNKSKITGASLRRMI